MILITGIGRSGTKYTAQLLQKSGINAGHEILLFDGLVCWKHVIFADKFDYVFHQVRDPLKTIGSLQTIHIKSMQLMAKFVDVDMSKSKLEQCMQAWVNWNLFCEQNSNYRYKVEEISQHWKTITKKFGKYRQVEMPQLPTDTHTRKDKYSPVTCEDLIKENGYLFDDIIKLAKKYGYDY